MCFVSEAHKSISIFISHNAENNGEAQHYEDLLSKAGFTAYQYGHSLRFGDEIRKDIAIQIKRCHFFLFIVSDFSLGSEWVQRELRLALKRRRESEGYRPIVIPIYAEEAAWRRTHIRPREFQTRDFDTGEFGEPLDLTSIRGVDRYENPLADSDKSLLSLMRPILLTSMVDFTDESAFDDSDVFTLYERSFPQRERDDREDIARWVLFYDLGKSRQVLLPDGTAVEYRLDSRYFILTLAGKAIGLAFYTYDYKNQLVYGNYIVVHQSWRSADLATAFSRKTMEVLQNLFPDYAGACL